MRVLSTRNNDFSLEIRLIILGVRDPRFGNPWCEGFTKYAVQTASGGMTYVSSFIKICLDVQKLLGWIQILTHRKKKGDLTGPYLFFRSKKSRLKKRDQFSKRFCEDSEKKKRTRTRTRTLTRTLTRTHTHTHTHTHTRHRRVPHLLN
jgi:hypothetical protein